MTASRSGLGPASGGDALESVTGKDRSNNDVKQPLTRLVVNFYRTVVAQAKKGGSRRHGAKALDLDSCCRTGEEQEQLAALAPSSALRAPGSEEHTSELQSLMRISYAVFCLKKKKNTRHNPKYSTNLTAQRQHIY